MGFSLREIANYLGRPVCLYEFAWQDTIWRYTSAGKDVEFPLTSGQIWEAVTIKDDGFSQGADAREIEITLPRALEVVQLFKGTPPSTPIAVTCYRFHKDDPDEEATVYWTGTIGTVRRVSKAVAKIIGLALGATMRRSGTRLRWTRNCTHCIFDAGCKLDKSLWAQPATITALDGLNISVDALGALPGEQYQGGFLEWEATAEGAIDRRAIETFDDPLSFALLGGTDRLEVGTEITLFPGCDLTVETCDGVFDNKDQHGGFRFMPRKSPFDGTPVF